MEIKDSMLLSIINVYTYSDVHKRSVYNILDLFGDLGGLIESTSLVFGFIFFPISKHSFFMKAIKKLFYANTIND